MADIISTLPDVVLTHILSFLPTKNSVATSVLSKRYRYLWRSVLTLNFSAASDQTSIFNFKEFVYSVLLSRDLDHPIKSFRLVIFYDGPDYDPAIIKWLNFVVQRQPENLYLQVLTQMNLVKLPLPVLTCTTLKSLGLSFCKVEGFSSVLLPSLKTLQLFNNIFNEVRDFMMFLAGCPILEELYVTLLSFKSDVNFVATSSFWINNSLNFRDWENFSLSRLIKSRVIDSHFDFPFKMLHNVKSLDIEIQKVYRPSDVIPTFHNLTHLKLMHLNYNWNLLTELLKHCPMLRELDLNQADIGLESWTREEGGYIWVDPEPVPECLSLRLKTCHLRNFLTLQGELLLAKYILKNARVLQDMWIWNNQETGIKKLFSSCPRASATCELTVFDCQWNPE